MALCVEFFQFHRGSNRARVYVRGSRQRAFFDQVRGPSSDHNLKRHLTRGFSIDPTFKRPVSRWRTFGKRYSPKTGKTSLRGDIIEAGHGGKLAAGTTDVSFTVMSASHAFPLKIDDNFPVVRDIEDGTRFSHGKASVALFSLCTDENSGEMNLGPTGCNATCLLSCTG